MKIGKVTGSKNGILTSEISLLKNLKKGRIKDNRGRN